ncbi:hypothetical protein [Kangiella sediminilitoris]|uniref:Lysozyme inhibitor LprI N-terminal domain-containing protein n=1 Tax=Kangiella sediminilitoris TaxID=1144748 RepID=A0A1B3B9H3_9GAMM|nr:hypothetical protein [Kangiella sediminilitoris]AOE49418.1 hypothetical protein KS2013_694 [Kangiella sediminilitoris]
MNILKLSIILSLFAATPSLASDHELLIQRDLEKVIGTGTLFTEYQNSKCGNLLDGELPRMVQKINQAIEKLETEVKPKYPIIWKEVTASDSRINKKAEQWVSRRIEKVKGVSSNHAFGCGLIFGELLTFGYEFESNRVSLMINMKESQMESSDSSAES